MPQRKSETTADEGQTRMNDAAREVLKTPDVQKRLADPKRTKKPFKVLISRERLIEKIMADPDDETITAGSNAMTQTTAVSGIERASRNLFIRHQCEHEGASSEWATRYWDENANAPHKGDCPYAEHQGPITCDRCACDEYRFKARVVIEDMQNVEG